MEFMELDISDHFNIKGFKYGLTFDNQQGTNQQNGCVKFARMSWESEPMVDSTMTFDVTRSMFCSERSLALQDLADEVDPDFPYWIKSLQMQIGNIKLQERIMILFLWSGKIGLMAL